MEEGGAGGVVGGDENGEAVGGEGGEVGEGGAEVGDVDGGGGGGGGGGDDYEEEEECGKVSHWMVLEM